MAYYSVWFYGVFDEEHVLASKSENEIVEELMFLWVIKFKVSQAKLRNHRWFRVPLPVK